MILDRLSEHLHEDAGVGVSRRAVLTAGAAAGGGLLIGIGFAAAPGDAQAASNAATAFAPNAFIRIDDQSRVTMVMPYVEMGQGTYTAIPMLIAEELEIDVATVRLEHAPPNDKLYANGALGFQVTGGSTAIRAAYEPMRRAGAAARTLLVQAAAQRWRVDPASCSARNGQVVHGASGRHATYGALVADASRLPLPKDVALKPRSEYRVIGTAQRRLDTKGKVDGSSTYGIDARVPGMKFAALMQAPAYGGRLRAVDDSKARAVAGVRQIVKLDDCIAVVADHTGAARKGLAALVLDWDDGPNAALTMATLVESMRAASLGGAAATARSEGDNARAMAGAATRLEAVYQVPFLAHAAMEPMNCTVHVGKDRCEVWVGTQVLTRAHAAAAQMSGLPADKVVVHNHLLGGGFGRRLDVDGVARAVQIARNVDGPVQVIWSREEDIRRDIPRPYFYDRLSAGLDAQGQPVAWFHRITGSSIIKRWLPPAWANGLDPDTIDGAERPPYELPNILVEYVNHEPPHIPTAFWRGVGPTHNVFVVESFMDELAHAAKKDPGAYRLALLERNPRAHAVLQRVLADSGWGSSLPAGQGRGVAVQFAFGSFMAQVAEVEVAASGDVTVRRIVCAVDCGVVVNSDIVRAQVQSAVNFGISAALWGQITFQNGRVEQSNFHDYRPLRIHEAPSIDIAIVASAEAPGGMGEPGTSCVAPAITNAIFAATGKRLRSLPIDAGFLKNA